MTFACSSNKDQDFANECTKDHKEVCDYCEKIPQVIQAIGGGIEQAQKEGMDDEDGEEMLFQLNTCFKDILSYKHHVMRSFSQNLFWDQLMSVPDESKAFLCQDWAMKWIGESFRESLKDFFAKAGMYPIYLSTSTYKPEILI